MLDRKELFGVIFKSTHVVSNYMYNTRILKFLT